MAKNFLRKKPSKSVQDKIDLLKELRKRSAVEEPNGDVRPMPPPDPEDLEYLRQLEEAFRGGRKSAPSSEKPGGAGEEDKAQEPLEPRRPPRSRRAEANGEERLDPFPNAEREIETLIKQGQRKRQALKDSPPATEGPEYEPEDEPEPIEPEPEWEPEAEAEPESPRQDETVEREAVRNQTPVAVSPGRAMAEERDYDRQGKLPFPPGTIVRLGDDSVAIIREEIHNREYDLVYILCADGRIDPRGVRLYAYDLERLGRLPREELERIDRRQFYDRDRIIYYLDDVSYVAGFPKLLEKSGVDAGSSAEGLTKPEPHDDGFSLLRGRQLSIVSGGKSWEAVYWGEGQGGAIVAYSENGHWDLLRLDLERFGEAVKRGPLMPNDEVRAIEEEIIQAQGSRGQEGPVRSGVDGKNPARFEFDPASKRANYPGLGKTSKQGPVFP